MRIKTRYLGREMIRLQFYKNNESLFSIQTGLSFFRVGRGSDCEVTISDASLSRTHCLFRLKDNEWRAEDVSSNGVQVEGEFIGPQFKLQKSKRYQISPQINFEWVDSLETDSQKTLILSRRPTQIIMSSSEPDKLILGEARLTGLNEKGEKINRRINTRHFSIGRHPSNDLRIISERVSQFHARIELRNNEYFFVDLGSTNGSFLDGKKVLRASLPPFAKLQLGDTHWQFGIEREDLMLKDPQSDSFFGMISRNKKMKRLFAMSEAVAQTDAAVLIHGETGSGKELLARAIHDLSPRSSKAFVTLNCAAMPKDLIESELFGHLKGSFTGAAGDRTGAFEAADGGSLFLDEIAEMDINLQAKLLRCLETGEVKKIGSNQSIQTSVRIIAATHKNLLKMVQESRFREDLFFRLQVVPLELPPLRERLEDLELLVPSLLEGLRENAKLDPGVYDILKQQVFPGNIRQLKNILQRGLVEFRLRNSFHPPHESKILDLQSFQFLNQKTLSADRQSQSQLKEREELLSLLRGHGYNQSKTARELRVPISTLHDRIRRLSIEIPKRRKA